MLDAFKKFAFKGNVLDMAVGIIIGAAFSTMVKSLVDNVVMPPIGLVTGGVDFSDKTITLKEAIPAAGDAPAVEAVTMNYGQFINDTISFMLVAFVLFIIVKKFIAALEKEEEPEPDPAPPADIALLTEIRDLLKKD